ncbi:MAG: DUF4139 domain-containing protein [Saprospiraceae bacterium]
MKKIILYFLVMMAVGFAQANSLEKSIPSNIEEVTVFQSGAQVMRAGKTSIDKGQSTLIFTGISPQIDPNSIQFSATGDFTILSINHQLDYLTPPEKDEKLAALESKKQNFVDQLAEEQALLSVFQEEESLLIANKAIGSQQTGVDIDNLKAIAAFYHDRLKAIRLEKLDLDKKIKQINEEVKTIDQQLAILKAQYKTKATSQILVAISAEAPTNATFRLTYLIQNAGWTPLYDIRVKDISSPAQLQYKAKVFQHSGEDWNQVKLSLSTGNPRASGTKPTLAPWWLQPIQVYTYREKDRAQTELLQDAYAVEKADGEALKKEAAPATYANATAIENSTSWEFQIRLPYDVPSDGQAYTVGINEYDLPATYEYYVAPKLDLNAYLTAKITNWETYRLLSGTANLFFEGTFLGQSHLDVNNTKDTLSISLGQDKGIVVQRTRDQQFNDKQLLGVKQTQTTGWTIDIRNKKRQAVNIVIQDQIPLTTSDEVDVRLENAKEAKHNADTGQLTWTLSLKPNENKTLNFAYSVKYPKKMNLALE